MSLQKLQQMIDGKKQYSYRGKKAVFKSHESIHGQIQVTVEIDGEDQIFYKDNEAKLGLFLDCFQEMNVNDQPVDNSHHVVQRPQVYAPDLYVESKGQFKSIIDMLMTDIEKVREDPSYVNQAKQVCNNVTAIVNITKLQIQLIQKN